MATFDNIIISSSHNITMARHWLGRHKNLSSEILLDTNYIALDRMMKFLAVKAFDNIV